MTREQLIEDLWWEIRGLDLSPEDSGLIELLCKAYALGFDEGSLEAAYEYR